MTVHTRLRDALDRIAAGTGAKRARQLDTARAERNGEVVIDETHILRAAEHLERAADELEASLGDVEVPKLRAA